MGDIKLKATNEQQEKQTKTHSHRQRYGGYQREGGLGDSEGKGVKHGDRSLFDFGW